MVFGKDFQVNKKEIPLIDLAMQLNGELTAYDEHIVISGVAGLKEASSGDISFLGHRRYLKDLEETNASAVVLPNDVSFERLPSIRVENPYYAFSQLLHIFYDLPFKPGGIDKRAVIGKGFKPGRDITIYPHVHIEDNVSLGDNIIIYPFTFIGANSFIGDNTIIYPNVTIREKTKIGCRVIVHSGAVIGSDGFGFVKYKGVHNKIPQVGGVIIEDDVEIGANTAIDRATIGNTVIKRGTKIDNLVQIAHNVTIGEDCILAGQAGVAGSSQIGNSVTLAGQAGVTGHISIGDNVTVAGKAGVTRDIKDDQTISGMPAIPRMEWLKAMAIFEKLPELKQKLSEIERRIGEIERIDRHDA